MTSATAPVRFEGNGYSEEWKLEAASLEPAKARYLVGYDPAEAKKLLAEAGYAKGFTMPIYHWPGYVVPWRNYYELAAEDLGKIGITVELKPEDPTINDHLGDA